MEDFKRYLPWIIGGAILLIILSRLSSRTTKLAPQTQFVETQQVDQFAESRASAFAGLLDVVGLQIGAEAETARARLQYDLGLKALETDLSKSRILADAATREAEFNYLSRENDRQIQQGAIDRYYSSRNTSNIVGSVTQALSSIFGSRSGGGIFTPPTFPRGGLF
jgi:hypothetical protein